MTIGEVAKRTGLATSALRYYEDAGVLPAPSRINGRRVYGEETVRVVEVVRFAQRAGFTLDEIRTLFHGFGADTPLNERWDALAKAKVAELDALIERAARMKLAILAGLDCGCVRVEDCVVASPGGPDAANAG